MFLTTPQDMERGKEETTPSRILIHLIYFPFVNNKWNKKLTLKFSLLIPAICAFIEVS